MTAVERYCHRAMLIDHGKIQEIGEPAGRPLPDVNLTRDSARSSEDAAIDRPG